jgi:hypothetical protein
MCNQTVSLVAASLEQQGISTVVVQLLRMVAEKVRPPRALLVPFRHGYPLDTPNDPEKQRAVIRAALNLLTNTDLKPPAIVEYIPEARGQMAEDR